MWNSKSRPALGQPGFSIHTVADPIRNRMSRPTRSYSIRVVALFDLFRTPGCLPDCALDRGSAPDSYASCRQSDKAGNFLGSLCRSHSGFVPLAYSRNGDACCCCGFMADPTKTGSGNDVLQKAGICKPDSYDISPFNCLSKNSDYDPLELGLCHEALGSSHDPIDHWHLSVWDLYTNSAISFH